MSKETKEELKFRKRRGKDIWTAEGYEIFINQEGEHVAATTGEGRIVLEELDGESDAEALQLAKKACEEHRRGGKPEALAADVETVATAMDWVLGDKVWTATPVEGVVYAVEEAPEGSGSYYPQLYGDPTQTLGEPTTLEGAKEVCQEHHRETVGQPEIGERDTKPEKPGQLPAPQRADWVIPVPLTDAEMVQAFEAGRKLRRRKRSLQREVAASHERHKKLAKRNQELIDKLEEEIEELDEQMPEKPVYCVRGYVRDGEEIWVQYTDPMELRQDEEAEILHEHKLTQYEQRQLFGEGDPPSDKPPSKGVQLLEQLEASIKRAFEEKTPEAIAAAGEAIDAAAAHLQGEQLKELRVRHALVAATSVFPDETDPLPLDLDLSDRRSWTKFGATYTAGDTDGEHYAVGKGAAGLWVVHYTPATPRPCEPRQLPGEHEKLKDAFAAAHGDNQSRVRWPGDPESGLLVSKCGKYQLCRPLSEQCWCAEAIGGQDEDNTDLGEHDDLAAAQAACQADAELRRGGL